MFTASEYDTSFDLRHVKGEAANKTTRPWMPTVLLINPNTSPETTAMMHRIFREALPSKIDLISETAVRGAPMLTTEADLAVAADEVCRIGQARGREVSAIVIGAFGDPGLKRLSREVPVPVIGIGESSLTEAASGGRRFGVATTTPGLQGSIDNTVRALGLSSRFTGVCISGGDPLELAGDPKLQLERLAEAVQMCVKDGARVVVIGGGPLSESATRLTTRFDIPIVSPVSAAARRIAEMLCH